MRRFLIVGLGNPGERYERTRHNIGFMVLDELAGPQRTYFKAEKHALVTEVKDSGNSVLLAKPTTFMNRSGRAVAALMGKYQIAVENLIVVTDDFNLPFARLRLRCQGSDGGHNGLASVIQQLNSEDFPRLRVGVGHEKIFDTVRFVLSDFKKSEQKQLPDIIDRARDACLSFVTHGIAVTMNKFNVLT